MLQIFAITGITVFIYMLLFYLVAQYINDNSIVDIGWGLGFIVLTLTLIFSSEKILPSMLILSLMILCWGIRLSFFIYLRNLGKGEDFRYAKWRKDWGNRQPLIAFFRVFMLQGIIMWILSLPVMLVFSKPVPFPGWTGIAGLLIFTFGLFFEGIADAQLRRFKSIIENTGKIMTSGVWKFSRHPNYFGEATLWWGIGIYCFSVSGYWVCFSSPVIISLLLRYVSGVPLLEEKYKNRKDFQEYAARTPILIPFIGKKSL